MNKQHSEKQTAIRWLLKSFIGNMVLAAILFTAAGTWRWPMGWALVALFAGVSIATYLLVDASLIAERNRNRRSTERWDNLLMGVYGLITMVVVPVVAGLDYRYGWSISLHWSVQLLALAVNVAGWALHIWAMRANAYFAIVVRTQEERGQFVATGGPYAWVRHPGYVGGILFNLSTPVMLGSLWALIPGLIGAALMVARTALEDRLLQDRLDGYADFTHLTRYRLLPGIW